MKINIEKTKIIIFNKSGKLLKNYRFYINDVQLENAQEYKYLGILMRASGTLTNAIQYLSNKALNFIFMIRRRFQTEAIKSNRKAMNRNWSNQKANPALKTKTGN